MKPDYTIIENISPRIHHSRVVIFLTKMRISELSSPMSKNFRNKTYQVKNTTYSVDMVCVFSIPPYSTNISTKLFYSFDLILVTKALIINGCLNKSIGSLCRKGMLKTYNWRGNKNQIDIDMDKVSKGSINPTTTFSFDTLTHIGVDNYLD